MKKRITITIWVLTVLVLGPAVLIAQKANYELAEQFSSKKMEKMVGSTSVKPEWIDGKDQFWYTYSNSSGKNWYFVDIPKRRHQLLFDREDLAEQLTTFLSTAINPKDLPLKDFKYDPQKKRFTFTVEKVDFSWDAQTERLSKEDSVKGASSKAWATYSPDSTWIAFAKNHDLYLMRSGDPDSTEYRLTNDGERWYSYQASSGDTTSGKRLRSNARWFKDSKKLWVNRRDSRKVGLMYVIKSLTDPRPELIEYKEAIPGDKEVTRDHFIVFQADVGANEKKINLQLERSDWPDATIGWGWFGDGISIGKGSDYLYLQRRNRAYNEVDILKVDTRTGEAQVLFNELDEPYFNALFSKLHVLNDGQDLIWWSERTGWGHFYLYNGEGKLKNRITKGHFMAGDAVKIDTTAKVLYFNGYGREPDINPYYAQLYRVNFDGTNLKRITGEPAHHQISAAEKGNYFVDNMSRADLPTQSVVRDGNGKIIMELQQTDVSEMEQIGWKSPELFTLKAADGITDLYGVMWKPFDFDPTKKYPVITHVYPGPQTEPFPINFRLSSNTALAQLGFIVVAMGQRGGSPYRHKAYHTFGYGNLRDYPLIDNKTGIEQLAAQNDWMDINRVGIWGHSGGGFMSAAAILTYPEFYKVAWSESGNHDNNIYHLWWSEMQNGVKKSEKKTKGENSPFWEARVNVNQELAANLQGRLMLVTGTSDNNVNPANSIRLADALIKAGKNFDYMIVPDKPHSYQDYSNYVEHRKWHYFSQYLLDDVENPVQLLPIN